MMSFFSIYPKLAVVVAIIFIFVVIAYLCVKYFYNYWHRRGIKFIKPSFPFGNFSKVFMQKQSIGMAYMELYNKTVEPFVGIFVTFRPMLLIRDRELCQHIMVKDFQHFHDRGVYVDEKHNPLSGNLFALNGEKWKNLRAKLTPTFSSGKLKIMCQKIVDCGENLSNFLSNTAANGETIEMQEVLARFTTDAIASVAFGIEVDSINEPDNVFREIGRKVFAPTLKNAIRGLLIFIVPKLNIFTLKVVDYDVEEFILSMVRRTMEMREKNIVNRKDFMQLLMQLRNTGKIENGDEWNIETVDDKLKKLTLNEVAAQVFIFYVAGFETSSTTMTFCLFELAKNPYIQRKAQNEIDKILESHGNKLTYDAIMEMNYLEMCIDETLRKYPPLSFFNRVCTKEYQIPGTNTLIEEGTAVLLPCLAIQRDPRYYPDPDKFIPERFTKENLDKLQGHMSFGDGPRTCIGLRLGKLQAKVGLVTMLAKYEFSLSDCLIGKELEMSPKNFIMTPIGGLELKINYRKKN